MKKLTLAIALLIAAPAFAQQTTVQQLMTNDANIKAALADQLDKANAQIVTLKAENEALKKTQNKPEAKKPLEKPVGAK